MSLIKNLIKEPEKKPNKGKHSKDAKANANEEVDGTNAEEESKKPRPFIKTATDLQRLRLEKLMKNPDKPIMIPEPRREKDYMQCVPTFVRNVMGSSAGAGSGEFHVYRHLRRKEYARQKTIQAKSTKEQLDDEYQNKLEENRRKAEEKTAKKRAKRLKKKKRSKRARSSKSNTGNDAHNVTSDGDDDDDDGTDEESEEEKKECEEKRSEKTENDVEESDKSCTNEGTSAERAVDQQQEEEIADDTTNSDTAAGGDEDANVDRKQEVAAEMEGNDDVSNKDIGPGTEKSDT